MMAEGKKVAVRYSEAEPVNGLGQMMGQYLEQNLAEFHSKVRQALKLNICAAITVDKGISATIRFKRDDILIENGVSDSADLGMRGSYLLLADVLAGKASPFLSVIRGDLKILKYPWRKPFQAIRLIRFLKIPKALIIRSK
jgi:hypothetical protein